MLTSPTGECHKEDRLRARGDSQGVAGVAHDEDELVGGWRERNGR